MDILITFGMLSIIALGIYLIAHTNTSLYVPEEKLQGIQLVREAQRDVRDAKELLIRAQERLKFKEARIKGLKKIYPEVFI